MKVTDHITPAHTHFRLGGLIVIGEGKQNGAALVNMEQSGGPV